MSGFGKGPRGYERLLPKTRMRPRDTYQMNQPLFDKVRDLEVVFGMYENIACIYLFGSQLTSLSTRGSDIDLALLTKDGDFKDKALLAYEAEKDLGFVAPVELVILNQQNLIFKFNVIREGKIVYETDR